MAANESGGRRSAAGPWLLLIVLGVAGYGAWRYLQSLPSGDAAPAAAAAPAETPVVSTFATNPADAATPGQQGSPQPGGNVRAGGAAAPGGSRRAAPSAAPDSPAPGATNPLTGASSPSGAGSSSEPERSSPPSGSPESVTDSAIYDGMSAGVKIPVLITPGANTPLLTGVKHPPGTPGIEVIINADGLVASVRAVTKPVSLAESLEYHNGLSVAKTWMFQPALREGHPVKFRIFFPLAILRTKSAIK